MTERNLTLGEIALAKTIFGSSINYSTVKITYGHNSAPFIVRRIWNFASLGSGPLRIMAPSGGIHYPQGNTEYSADISQNNIDAQATFIHEMTHVLQKQHGVNLINRASGEREYSYSISGNQTFADLNIEQQGEVMRDLFYRRNNLTRVDSAGNPISPSLQQLEKFVPKDLNIVDYDQGDARPDTTRPEKCFLAGTKINMSNGSQKNVENIVIGDLVKSFDQNGEITSGAVVNTMLTAADAVIDFHGVTVTPGHAYFCGDGEHKGQFLLLIDIIRADGAVVDADGQLIRAATNFPVGSEEDAFVEVAYLRDKSETELRRGKLRAGTRLLKDDGSDVTVLSCLEHAGYQLLNNGLVQKDGGAPEPLHWFGEPPKPEDYILKRSNLLNADINVAVH